MKDVGYGRVVVILDVRVLITLYNDLSSSMGLIKIHMGRLIWDVRVCVIPMLHYDGSLLKCL